VTEALMAQQQKATQAQAAYGRIHRSLHWLVASLIAAQFAIAWSMPEIEHDTKPEGLIGLHLAVGAVILFVVIARLIWRLANPVPLNLGHVPLWQQRSARAAHALLYVLLLALPVLGWAHASSHGWRIDLFGLASLPRILPAGSPAGGLLGDVHSSLAYVLLGLVGLHIAAVLYHQFRLRDGILSRML
jgi:cytochrome b561